MSNIQNRVIIVFLDAHRETAEHIYVPLDRVNESHALLNFFSAYFGFSDLSLRQDTHFSSFACIEKINKTMKKNFNEFI